jgi:signal transduction histidine kinase
LVVWAEPTRVQQILTNLLSNAVKYSAPGTPIEVSARILGPGEPKAQARRARRTGAPKVSRAVRSRGEIVVRDHGHGIPPDQIPLLFERFVRLPRDLASNVVGNGLGLYLCRAFAEAMGGRVWVESRGIEGDGSMFHVELAGVAGATPV